MKLKQILKMQGYMNISRTGARSCLCGRGGGISIEYFTSLIIYDIFANEYAGMTPFCFLDKKDGVIFSKLDRNNVPGLLLQIKRFFKKFVDFDFSFQEYNGFSDLIASRIASIKNWYFAENGLFLQNLLDNFQDSVSQVSFISYLKQRFMAKIHGDVDIVYPVKPPKETGAWRKDRFSREVTLPIIQGVSEKELKFYHETTFILEQYAIENALGVKESDVVIDAGGFVGDTALYFAQKCGKSGKVYSFEPIPRIVEIANRNIALNNFEGIVEMIPHALSDKRGEFEFLDLASGSRATGGVQGEAHGNVVKVASIPLDEFIESRKISRVDFIKSDLEGWDQDFLKGAARTIKTFKPQCGLTLYHKPDDIVEIPRFLLQTVPDYKFWFRSETEPVLFARPA